MVKRRCLRLFKNKRYTCIKLVLHFNNPANSCHKFELAFVQKTKTPKLLLRLQTQSSLTKQQLFNQSSSYTHTNTPPLLCCFYAHTFISEKLTGADDSVSLCPCDGSAAPSPVGGRCFNLEEGQSAEECPLSKQNKSSACLPLI